MCKNDGTFVVLGSNPHMMLISVFSRGIPLIGGGQDAQPSSVPWQVSIQTIPKLPVGLCGELKNLSIHFCGGSIIDDTTILTAAHCFLTS